jgi:hypothetical protein
MLIECPECKRQVSDQAAGCPHCGHPINPLIREVAPTARDRSSAPIFLVLASIALALSLFTPRLLLFFPVMGTLGCAAISFLRREKGRIGAAVVFVFGVGLLIMNETGAPSGGGVLSSPNLAAAEIVGWNWRKDPSFGTHGTIKWNVQVRNKTSDNISSVKVEFTTYDKSGKLISSTFTYVSAIPPGQTRSGESFADLYMTEEKAAVQIADVRLSY